MKGDVRGAAIRWRIHIPVPPEVVFEALNSDSQRARYWALSAPEVAGKICFSFVNGVRQVARIVERRPPSFFSLEYFEGIASFTLTPSNRGGTDVLLTHEGVGNESWIEVHAGWLNVLFPLKVFLIFGQDIRNNDPERTWDHGYADQ